MELFTTVLRQMSHDISKKRVSIRTIGTFFYKTNILSLFVNAENTMVVVFLKFEFLVIIKH